ncbi:MAG: DMT family transporter [Alphaproteobacteria bacterium]|nr:DMT family transporter [Alphaproteobacteria bacterium]
MRKPTPRDVALLCLLGAMWGGTFPAVKIAVMHLPATAVAAARLLVAALFMGMIAWIAGHRLPTGRDIWVKYLAIAAIGNVLPFILIAHGQRGIDAGLAAILMASMPLVTLVLAHFFAKGEPLTLRHVAGVLMGLAGMVVLVGVDVLEGLGGNVLSQIEVAAGALCYSVHTILARRIVGLPALTNAACALGASAALAVPVALLAAPIPVPPADAVAAILFAGMLGTGLGYTLYFHIVGKVGANFAALSNYLVPVAGVGWSALVLAERPSLRALFALAMILGGIAVTHLRRRTR